MFVDNCRKNVIEVGILMFKSELIISENTGFSKVRAGGGNYEAEV